MRLGDRKANQQMDIDAENNGITLMELMENAGKAAFQNFISLNNNSQNKLICILVGPGNKGGDALVMARHLLQNSYNKIKIIKLDTQTTELNQFMWKKIENLNFEWIKDPSLQIESISRADFIIDGIFGVGLNREIKNEYYNWIKYSNASKANKYSLDIPSGIECNSGQVLGIAFKANFTICFGLLKIAFYQQLGPQYCGNILITDIGFPKQLYKKNTSAILWNNKLTKRYLPKRNHIGNKTQFGKLGIYAGSKEMPGAAILAIRAAIACGSSYNFYLKNETYKDLFDIVPEVVPLKELNKWQQCDAFLIGPGVGNDTLFLESFNNILSSNKAFVLDADAINLCKLHSIKKLHKNCIMTPHSGELARLLNLTGETIDTNRVYFAQKVASDFNCVVLLKGFKSIITDGTRTYIIPTGNIALAKAGSGDVLSGMIAAFICQGLPAFVAAIEAAYLHGLAADQWTLHHSNLSYSPSQIIADLPKVLKQIEDSN